MPWKRESGVGIEPRAFPWEAWVARLLKIPPPPEAPAGSAGSVQIFRAARGFYLYRLAEWGLSQAGGGVGLFVGVGFLEAIPDATVFGFPLVTLLKLLEVFAVLSYFAQLPFTFALVHLDYRMRWYVVTNKSLRVREGVWRVREQTMTFSNIQNMAIRQGPLQRLLGIEDLEVRTAGGGETVGKGESQHPLFQNMHLAYFRGVEGASRIRDAILAHLRGTKSSGLGDPDEPEAAPFDAPPPAGEPVLAAAAMLLDEARALRRAAETMARDPVSP